MSVADLLNYAVVPMAGVLWWVVVKVIRLDAIAVGTETTRAIIREQLEPIHHDIEKLTSSVEELARLQAKRRREDDILTR